MTGHCSPLAEQRSLQPGLRPTYRVGWGGLLLYTPLKRRLTIGCWLIGAPSMEWCVEDTADQMELIELYCKPSWNSAVRNAKNG